ncbi:hypothetical protein CSIM01_06644 [Colletotrichum simmondsii]|uniref:Uncharacterized protein n=1 Tax=Colletotrichum simmondsii TaxID=703756 RepID=A0A135SUI7_9PEZI|nr:hypothetical protein CSIM01_06644 [Colletotrichum simmondsii]
MYNREERTRRLPPSLPFEASSFTLPVIECKALELEPECRSRHGNGLRCVDCANQNNSCKKDVDSCTRVLRLTTPSAIMLSPDSFTLETLLKASPALPRHTPVHRPICKSWKYTISPQQPHKKGIPLDFFKIVQGTL